MIKMGSQADVEGGAGMQGVGSLLEDCPHPLAVDRSSLERRSIANRPSTNPRSWGIVGHGGTGAQRSSEDRSSLESQNISAQSTQNLTVCVGIGSSGMLAVAEHLLLLGR